MTIHYVMDILRKMIVEGVGAIEVRDDVFERYNASVDQTNDNMVWTHPGMTTYYRNSRGRVVINYPFKNIDYFTQTRAANLDEFIIEARLEPAAL